MFDCSMSCEVRENCDRSGQIPGHTDTTSDEIEAIKSENFTCQNKNSCDQIEKLCCECQGIGNPNKGKCDDDNCGELEDQCEKVYDEDCGNIDSKSLKMEESIQNEIDCNSKEIFVHENTGQITMQLEGCNDSCGRGSSENMASSKKRTDTHFRNVFSKQLDKIDELKEQRQNHFDEKLHSCGLCSKIFRQKSALKTHMIIHMSARLPDSSIVKSETADDVEFENMNIAGESPGNYDCSSDIFGLAESEILDDCKNDASANTDYKNESISGPIETESENMENTCNQTGEHSKQNEQSDLKAMVSGQIGFECNKMNSEQVDELVDEWGKYDDQNYGQGSNDMVFENHIFVGLELQNIFSRIGNYNSRNQTASPLGKEFKNAFLKRFSEIKPYSCDICGKKFKCFTTLTAHCLIHTDEFPYSCELCGKGFRQQSNRNKHMITHMSEKMYKCDLCGMDFKWKSSLFGHIEAHLGDSYECTHCNKSLSTEKGLKSHVKSVHGGRKFKCQYCKKAFKSSNHLKQHIASHEQIKKFPCEICSKKFMSKTYARKHKLVHTGEKPFKCDICFYASNCLTNLRRHKRIHKAEKFVCEYCNKESTNYDGHKRHVRFNHTETEKNFVCDLCNKKYSERARFMDHMLRHTGERNFECDVCGKKYKTKLDLKTHIRFHNEKKDKACEICRLKFVRQTSLRRHVKEVHSKAK